MPPSFAVTELLIVLTAYFCSLKLRKHYPFAVIGISLFGLAALIGVYRFSSGQVDQLASIHKYISQAGALLGLILITKEIILAQVLSKQKPAIKNWGYVIIIISLFFVNIFQSYIVPAYIICSLASIILAYRLAGPNKSKKLFYVFLMSIMPLNLILVRNSELLNQVYSWHIFHILVAAWVYGIYHILDSAKLRISSLPK